MRVAVIVESPVSEVNGVTHSVVRVVRHLRAAGDRVLIVSVQAPRTPAHLAGAPVTTVPSLPLPGYPEVRIAMTTAAAMRDVLQRFAPDVVHLASPVVLGWRGLLAAESLGIPTVAVYQTDLIAFAGRYRMSATRELIGRHLTRLHARASITLAPSSASISQLENDLGVPRVHLWARGVDTAQFRPDRRDARLRRSIAGDDEVVLGYIGRLAPEKQLEDLAAIAGIPGTRIVLVGDGPSRPMLERLLPEAVFLGHLTGTALARAVASLDVFVHPGEAETFGQAIQEALASGVPVVAPGVGGPIDLVRSSRTGWLYRPGDLVDLRTRVEDLVGDAAKRRAFGVAAAESVAGRSWDAVCAQLRVHYEEVIAAAVGSRVPPKAPRLGRRRIRL